MLHAKIVCFVKALFSKKMLILQSENHQIIHIDYVKHHKTKTRFGY